MLVALGDRIRRLRLDAGLKQEDLAFKAELQQYQISKIETGSLSASVTTLYAISLVLKVSLPELLTFPYPTEK